MIELIDKRLVNNKSELFDILKSFLENKFQISGNNVEIYLNEFLTNYFSNLKENGLSFLVEYPYTDKVYRNSFYHYYASKLYAYKRDCIRVSVFSDGIAQSDFRDQNQIDLLKKAYLGFFVVRPLTPALLGRKAIQKEAFIHGNKILTMAAPIHATVNGIKFTVRSFPHSSQDSETISCAETTL